MSLGLLDELCPDPPSFSIDWGTVDRILDRDVLAATPQGPEYHAEGDVWTHTRMVCEALTSLPAWRALEPSGRAIVFAGALFHDIGKPASTRAEPDGRISSRGHSARGDILVRRLLWHAAAPFGAREHVCALVRHHQVPFFLIESTAAVARQTLARLSLVTRCSWLALVAEADARGRRCLRAADQQKLIDNTALFLELARDEGVADRPRAFPSENTRFVYLRTDDPGRRSPDVTVHDDTACEVVVMSGLPAAGKDAWLARNRPDLRTVGLDAVRDELDIEPGEGQGAVLAAARERARDFLRRGEPFAWNATNISQVLRTGLIDFLTAYSARTHIVYVEAPAALQDRRNRARRDPVPRAALERMLDRWSPPRPAEAHRVSYAVEEVGPEVWPPPG